MDAAISRQGPMRASKVDSYLTLERDIKAIPAGFGRMSLTATSGGEVRTSAGYAQFHLSRSVVHA
jgi:hypothetical protein